MEIQEERKDCMVSYFPVLIIHVRCVSICYRLLILRRLKKERKKKKNEMITVCIVNTKGFIYSKLFSTLLCLIGKIFMNSFSKSRNHNKNKVCFSYLKKFFYWSIVDLECVNFCCRAKWFSYICIFFFFILFSIIVFLRILNIASGFCLQRVYSSLPVWEAWLQQRWGCGLWALRDLGSNSSGSTNWSWARRLNSSLFRFFFPICNIGVKSAFGRFAKVETTVSTVPGT